jgi:YVTN family beta-propeller protein
MTVFSRKHITLLHTSKMKYLLKNPESIIRRDKIYVANSESNTLPVLNASNDKEISEIPVGESTTLVL